MNKKLSVLIFLIILAIIGIAIFYRNKANQRDNLLLGSVENKTIFFFGEGCPHCTSVEEFFEENNIESKIQFDKREIYSDKENAYLLKLIANRKCNLSQDEIGVPFLWDGSKCIIGDEPIINYFKEKISS